MYSVSTTMDSHKSLLIWIAVVNTISATAVVIFVVLASLGAITGLQVGADAGLTTDNLKALFEDVLYTASNVRNVTGSAVPVARSAKTNFMETDWQNVKENALNATKHLPVVTRQQVGAFFGNMTRMLSSLADAHYSAVTTLLSDAHNPAMQSTIRHRVDHALRSFDYATFGMTEMFGLFKQGLTSTAAP